jgi:hypothetical protein
MHCRLQARSASKRQKETVQCYSRDQNGKLGTVDFTHKHVSCCGAALLATVLVVRFACMVSQMSCCGAAAAENSSGHIAALTLGTFLHASMLVSLSSSPEGHSSGGDAPPLVR